MTSPEKCAVLLGILRYVFSQCREKILMIKAIDFFCGAGGLFAFSFDLLVFTFCETGCLYDTKFLR